MNKTCPFCLGSGELSINGQRIMDARKQSNMSRQDLADACGLSHVTIRNIECGFNSPSRQTLELLIEEFDSKGIELI